jgi:microcystin-dependent protein
LSTNTYDRTTQHEESYKREHAEHEGLYRSSLHLCDELRQSHITTSVDTAISTSAVATSSSSQESVNCMNSLTLKQLIAAMSVNDTQNSVSLIHSDLKKRVKFRP